MTHLFDKYKIEKTDGTPVEPGAMYFVLRVDTDPHARIALRAYARSIRSSDPDFAQELDEWIDSRPAPAERTPAVAMNHSVPAGTLASPCDMVAGTNLRQDSSQTSVRLEGAS